MKLKSVWNKLQYAVDACDFIDPSDKVIKEMEKDGWTFRAKFDFNAAGMYPPAIYTYLIPVTPEGEDAFGPGKQDLHKRYGQERREAAKRVYGIK